MKRLDVIGNVSRDVTRYPDHRGGARLGGAALLVALAAAKAGRPAAPVCVLGDDLAHLPQAAELNAIDWSAHSRSTGPSTRFELEYDQQGDLVTVRPDYGVADQLTAHALAQLDDHPENQYHVCCRRPLDTAAVLERLTRTGAEFSVDFFLPSAEAMIRASAPWLANATTIFVNAAEHRLLQSTLGTTELREIVVTDGPRAATIWAFGRQIAAAVPPPRPPLELSGAGDTLAGTFLAHRPQSAAPTALAQATVAAAQHVTAPSLPIPAQRRA